jgi:hypothetical protein
VALLLQQRPQDVDLELQLADLPLRVTQTSIPFRGPVADMTPVVLMWW